MLRVRLARRLDDCSLPLHTGCVRRAGTVPDEIKSELLQRIRRFAEQQS